LLWKLNNQIAFLNFLVPRHEFGVNIAMDQDNLRAGRPIKLCWKQFSWNSPRLT